MKAEAEGRRRPPPGFIPPPSSFILSTTCTPSSNPGNTHPFTLGRRQSISDSHASRLTRRFMLIASAMLTNPSHFTFATPPQSSHSGQLAHSRSGGQRSSTSSKHHRTTAVPDRSADSITRCISPNGACSVESASMVPAMSGRWAVGSGQSAERSDASPPTAAARLFVTNCAASHTSSLNSSTSSHRSFCTRNPRTARWLWVSTAAVEPPARPTLRRVGRRLASSRSPANRSKSGVK